MHRENVPPGGALPQGPLAHIDVALGSRAAGLRRAPDGL